MLLTTTTQSHLKIILLILIFLKTSYEVENVLVILLARAGAFLWLRQLLRALSLLLLDPSIPPQPHHEAYNS